MQLKPLVCAAALALAAVASHAEDLAQTVTLIPNVGSPGSFSASFGVTHEFAGAFTDTFTINGTTIGSVSASLITIGFDAQDDIHFSSATLNDVPLQLMGNGTLEWGVLTPTDMLGVLTLVVQGIAAPTLGTGEAIAASFGGTVNVSPPVPEPGTTAMLLAGLGVVALLGRRSFAKR